MKCPECGASAISTTPVERGQNSTAHICLNKKCEVNCFFVTRGTDPSVVVDNIRDTGDLAYRYADINEQAVEIVKDPEKAREFSSAVSDLLDRFGIGFANLSQSLIETNQHKEDE